MKALIQNQNNVDVNNNDIVDIHVGGSKKKIRVDGDDNRILLLNTSDVNIVHRSTEAYIRLKELHNEVKELSEKFLDTEKVETDDDIAKLHEITMALKRIDDEMKSQIDYLFNANVSEVCCDGGAMYDVIDGRIRYEIIVDQLIPLYENIFKAEENRQNELMLKHTSKYTK